MFLMVCRAPGSHLLGEDRIALPTCEDRSFSATLHTGGLQHERDRLRMAALADSTETTVD